jgi:hypothetical protein
MKDFIVFFAPLICKEVLFGSKCKPRITKTMHNILESFVQQSSEFHVSWYMGTIPVLYVTFLPCFCRTFLERRKREYSNHERTQRESSKHGYAPIFRILVKHFPVRSFHDGHNPYLPVRLDGAVD